MPPNIHTSRNHARRLLRAAVAAALAAGFTFAGPGAAAVASPGPTGPSGNGPTGWDVYRRLDRLPELTDGSRSYQFSSFDRTGGNDDGFSGQYSCLRTGDEGCVIAEATGAGEIDSIWFTRDEGVVSATGTIKVVLDGRTVLDANLQDVVDGKLGAPFVYPVVANAEQSSGGVYIKAPMTYRSSMRVITQNNPVFYHVAYRKFSSADGVATFDPRDQAQDVIDKLTAAGTRDPKPAQPGASTSHQGFSVPAKGTVTLGRGQGPGVISGLRLRIPQLVGPSTPGADEAAIAASDEVLRASRLRISFDGKTTVDAPLGEFFGSGLGLNAVRSLMFGIDPATGTLSAWWPMPYRERFSVQLYNGSAVPIKGAEASVTSARSATWAPALSRSGDAGYFRATSNSEDVVPGADHLFLDTAGRGKFVGETHTMEGHIPAGNQRDYLEGDERVYVDGSLSPSVHGTGTEDFYESGWYFNKGTYTNPMNGNPVHETADFGCQYDCTGAYRLMLAEAVSFGTGLRFGIEHGPNDQDPAHYGSTAYWYGQDTLEQSWTDTVDVGDPASERAHGYSSGGDRSTLTSTYEGNDGAQTPGTDDLRASTTPIRFKVAVDARNDGVVLRRTADQAAGYQSVAVQVDGRDAGTWTQPLANSAHRWLDDEYRLPASLTRNKRSVTVTLTPTKGAPAWSAARYAALSLVAPFDDHTKPAGVTGINATGGTTNAVALNWRPAADDVYAPSYEVYAAKSQSFTPGPGNRIGATSAPSFQHTGLGLNETWYYRVRAVDAAGNAGPYSSVVSASTGDTMRLEVETLLPAAQADAPADVQGDCCGVHWSQGAQLWFHATGPNQSVTVPFTVPTTGTYRLSMVQTLAGDYGTNTVSIDGSQVGAAFDAFHSPEVVVSDPLDYGQRELSAGKHTLTITVTGKAAGSSNYLAGIDYLEARLAS